MTDLDSAPGKERPDAREADRTDWVARQVASFGTQWQPHDHAHFDYGGLFAEGSPEMLTDGDDECDLHDEDGRPVRRESPLGWEWPDNKTHATPVEVIRIDPVALREWYARRTTTRASHPVSPGERATSGSVGAEA